MECEICMDPFDHSRNRPFSLSVCAHTFCIRCLNSLTDHKCPTCSEAINGRNPNWALLKLIPESKFDKLKREFEKHLGKIAILKKELNNVREKQSEKNTEQIHLTRNQIYTRLNELVNYIQKEQAKLMEQTDSIEIFLANKLNDLYVKLEDDELNKIKTLLDQNGLNELELNDLTEQYANKITEINEQIKQVDQFQFSNYLFVASEIKEISFIGDIFIKKYIQEPKTVNDCICAGLAINEELNDHKKAIEYINKAIEIEAELPFPYFHKGVVLFQQNQFEGAIECFDKSMQLLKRISGKNESNLKEKLIFDEKNFELAKLIINTSLENEVQDLLKQMAQNSLKEAFQCFEKEAQSNETESIPASVSPVHTASATTSVLASPVLA